MRRDMLLAQGPDRRYSNMDFPLPIRSRTSVDCFTPLHVDTNIVYTLDVEKFPELNDPTHTWEPALVIGPQTCLPLGYSLSDNEAVPSSVKGQQLCTDSVQAELYQLIDSLEIDIPDDADVTLDSVNFVDLPSCAFQSLADDNLKTSSGATPLNSGFSDCRVESEVGDHTVTNYDSERLHNAPNCHVRPATGENKRNLKALDTGDTPVGSTRCKRRKMAEESRAGDFYTEFCTVNNYQSTSIENGETFEDSLVPVCDSLGSHPNGEENTGPCVNHCLQTDTRNGNAFTDCMVSCASRSKQQFSSSQHLSNFTSDWLLNFVEDGSCNRFSWRQW